MLKHGYKQLFAFVLLTTLGTTSQGEVGEITSRNDRVTVNNPSIIAQTVFQSSHWRQYVPLARPQELKAIATANNRLALDLYHAYGNDQTATNFAFSPFDIAQTLAMTAVGARGDTLAALLNELRVTLPAGRMHPAMSAATWNMMHRNQAGGLQQRNALWSQGRSRINQQAYYRFSPLFLTMTALYYYPEMEAIDYTNPSLSLATTEINPWIATRTDQSIQTLLDAANLSEKTRLVTASTLALNSLWQSPFDPGATVQGRFELPDKTHVQIPLMTQTGEFPYIKGGGYQAFEFPLANSDLGILVIMPDSGNFETFQSSLDGARLNAIAAALTPTQLTVRLPVIEVRTHKSLQGVLTKLSGSGAFSEGSANFAGVNNAGYLFLKALDHEAAFTLQAQGPKAAGATVVAYQATKDEPPDVWSGGGIIVTNPPCDSKQNYFDPSLTLGRPFLFAVRDHKTGSILTMGRVLKPDGVPVPADLVMITSCLWMIDPIVQPPLQLVFTQDNLAGRSVTITAGKATLIEDPLLAGKVAINVSAYNEANGEITLGADEITIRGDIAMLRTAPAAFTLNAQQSIEIPAVHLTADQLDGRSLIADGSKIDLIDNPAMPGRIEIVGGLTVPSGQALEFSGDTVRITGDLTPFKAGRSMLQLHAGDKITMGAVEVVSGSLGFYQGTLALAGNQVNLMDKLDVFRHSLNAIDIVGNQRIDFPAQGEVVQVNNDGLVITALSEQPLSFPRGQVTLERIGNTVALTKGTIALPADPSVGGTVTLTAGPTVP